jgi:alkanesulfonate monooxygenase SsuD/methylene tetrahydromethanopterin reductase-like flavin-dependent oxidoreductase (luciferase family)
LKRLWTRDRAEFSGRYYTLRDAIANPKPLQRPQPPIWMGAGGDQLLRVVARHADVWNGGGGTLRLDRPADYVSAAKRLTDANRRLDMLCEQIRRDPAQIRRLVQLRWDGMDRALLVERCRQWLEAGFSEQIVYLASPGALRAAEAAAVALPELRAIGAAAA